MSLKMDRNFWVHESRVQASRVQASRVQSSRRPESRCPESKYPGVQSPGVQNQSVRSPSVQTMRPESSFSGMPNFPEVLCKRGDLKNLSKFTDKHKKQSSAGVLSKDVFKNFAKFTEKHICRSLFFNKVAGWKPETVRSSLWRCSVKKVVLKKMHW